MSCCIAPLFNYNQLSVFFPVLLFSDAMGCGVRKHRCTGTPMWLQERVVDGSWYATPRIKPSNLTGYPAGSHRRLHDGWCQCWRLNGS